MEADHGEQSVSDDSELRPGRRSARRRQTVELDEPSGYGPRHGTPPENGYTPRHGAEPSDISGSRHGVPAQGAGWQNVTRAGQGPVESGGYLPRHGAPPATDGTPARHGQPRSNGSAGRHGVPDASSGVQSNGSRSNGSEGAHGAVRNGHDRAPSDLASSDRGPHGNAGISGSLGLNSVVPQAPSGHRPGGQQPNGRVPGDQPAGGLPSGVLGYNGLPHNGLPRNGQNGQQQNGPPRNGAGQALAGPRHGAPSGFAPHRDAPSVRDVPAAPATPVDDIVSGRTNGGGSAPVNGTGASRVVGHRPSVSGRHSQRWPLIPEDPPPARPGHHQPPRATPEGASSTTTGLRSVAPPTSVAPQVPPPGAVPPLPRQSQPIGSPDLAPPPARRGRQGPMQFDGPRPGSPFPPPSVPQPGMTTPPVRRAPGQAPPRGPAYQQPPAGAPGQSPEQAVPVRSIRGLPDDQEVHSQPLPRMSRSAPGTEVATSAIAPPVSPPDARPDVARALVGRPQAEPTSTAAVPVADLFTPSSPAEAPPRRGIAPTFPARPEPPLRSVPAETGTEKEPPEPVGEVSTTGTGARRRRSATSQPADGRPESASAGKNKKPKRGRRRRPVFWRELPMLIVVALLLTFLIQTFLARVYEIPSGSMETTLHGCTGCDNDRVLVDKLSYRFGSPSPGDVVVFAGPPTWTEDEMPTSRSDNSLIRGLQSAASLIGLAPPDEKDFIKRVIAVGGQTVACCDAQNRVTVDGKSLNEPYVYYLREAGNPAQSKFGPVYVPPGQLWVMGDSRNNSSDSRALEHFGPISVANVIGKARFVVLPIRKIKVVPDANPQKISLSMSAPGVPNGAPLALGVLGVAPWAVGRQLWRRRGRCRGTAD